MALYAASKAATLALVKGMSNDYAPEGIRVNAVLPGSVDTPLLRYAASRGDPQPAGQHRRLGQVSPHFGRVLDASEVAALVLFLCSDDAKAISGASFVIDGGMTAQLPGAVKQGPGGGHAPISRTDRRAGAELSR